MDKVPHAIYAVAVPFACALLLPGCGGTKVMRDAHPLSGAPAITASSDPALVATLDSVIVRNAPGSWARDANWDEYRLRVRSASATNVQVAGLVLVDALGARVPSSTDRGDLVDASREVEKRYAESGRLVRDGPSGAWMFVGGVAATGTGLLATLATVSGGMLGSGAVAVAGANLLVGGGLFLIGAGIVRVANNVEVGRELRRRETRLPLVVAKDEQALHAFFPITPLPAAIEIAYHDGVSSRTLTLDTREALAHLHAPMPITRVHAVEPVFPPDAANQRVRSGFARALLTLNAAGDVTDVYLLEASSRLFVREAIYTFGAWKYNAGRDDRRVEEVLHFSNPLPAEPSSN
jgi:hypothetical protein